MSSKTEAGELLAFLRAALAGSTDECVPWPFHRNAKGYGLTKFNRKTKGAHRWICEQAHGAPPHPKAQAAHRCGVTSCINPRHIRWASQSENRDDSRRFGTLPMGETHGQAKLTEAQVHAIREDRRPQAVIAEEYGISQSSVCRARRRQSWRHL
jgi:hypothetical protein